MKQCPLEILSSITDEGSRIKRSDLASITGSKFDKAKKTRCLIPDWKPSSSNNDQWASFGKFAMFAKVL